MMFLAAARIAANPGGAPQQSCSSMIPGHRAQPQTLESSPYKVEVSTTSARPGDTVDVTISGAAFMGFLLQARDSGDNLVGSFTNGVEGSQKLSCPGGGQGVTHKNRYGKDSITFKW